MKGSTFGLLLLSLDIPLGEQIAEQGHVLNAVPGQWLVATSQSGIRAFFDKLLNETYSFDLLTVAL
jgi:uroporphyrinogen-III synthase